jgi:hypothetical protein
LKVDAGADLAIAGAAFEDERASSFEFWNNHVLSL